jgi:hypothetical protein
MTSRRGSTFREVEIGGNDDFFEIFGGLRCAAIAATLGLDMAGAKAAENPGATIAANDNAEIAPVEAETPAGADEQTAQPAQEETNTSSPAESVAADQLKVGAAVFGADGAKICELNRVTSDASGKVEEIRVTGAAKPDSMPRFLRFRATRSPVSRTARGFRSVRMKRKSCRSSTTATVSSDCQLPESETRPHSKIGTRPFHIVQSKRLTSRTFCT